MAFGLSRQGLRRQLHSVEDSFQSNATNHYPYRMDAKQECLLCKSKRAMKRAIRPKRTRIVLSLRNGRRVALLRTANSTATSKRISMTWTGCQACHSIEEREVPLCMRCFREYHFKFLPRPLNQVLFHLNENEEGERELPITHGNTRRLMKLACLCRRWIRRWRRFNARLVVQLDRRYRLKLRTDRTAGGRAPAVPRLG